jgi:mono/diheme cytochrome c family protein
MAWSTALAEKSAPPIDFNRDIRAILADNCFQCHGPDQSQRKADLRLDVQADVLAKRDGGAPVVPGNATASELFRRITSADPDERMPPADSKRRLSPEQIELLKRWIDQGAPWQTHWSLVPPRRPATPQVKESNWLHNPIDAFVLDRIERAGLAHSPEADKTTLLRRVTLDLTGLPPTPDEVDAFLADDSPDAYERVVDRLLASPRYGERLAARWLDGARYADSNGYQSDGERVMWRWRDWVIEAYNRNLPFDQFTVEQLAGDLLPAYTLEQRIATGFNRNHRGNAEGGIVPEEYAVEYVVDRVDTTATVWLGLTLGCARCHDHKFDPFSQREYYQLFAYFNNVPERGKAVKYGNSPPFILSPTRDQQAELVALERQLAAAEQSFAELADQVAASQHEWEQALLELPPYDWNLTDGLVSHFPFDVELINRC